jgi:hypothetical protein
MAKITMTEAPEFVTFPTNSILYLRVEEIALKEVQGKKGTWEKLEFKFKILGVQAVGDDTLSVEDCEPAIGSFIWGGVSANLTDNPENKLRQWTEAILNMELSVGFELDTDLLVGRDVRGITGVYTKKTGFTGHQIDALLPKGGSFTPPEPKPVAASTAAAADPWQTDEPPF